jgi:sirohydrochlorin cobaltochelatase
LLIRSLGKIEFFSCVLIHVLQKSFPNPISRHNRCNPILPGFACCPIYPEPLFPHPWYEQSVAPKFQAPKEKRPSMIPNETALLVVGHGTRKAMGAEQLRGLVQTMRGLEPHTCILDSFLELAEPTIEQALERGAGLGIRNILVVPVLLFSAGHAKSDIPSAVDKEATRLGLKVLGQTPPLGTAEAVLQLSDARFQEMSLEARDAGCPPGHCGQVQCMAGVCGLRGRSLGRIGLAMVGRGTSDPEALAHMRQLTQLCAARRPLSWCQTGFFAGGTPNVEDLLEEAAHAACDSIIIQPHLLFEGELMDQLRSKLLERRERFPDRNWLMTRSLGADPGLARLLLAMAQEALATLANPILRAMH